jgi:Cu(I)/Ag(I) efflux system periplasmic protein CusF
MKPLFITALVAATALAAPAPAQQKADDHAAHHPAPAAAADMTDGEVRKVDRDNAKLTLKHAEIKSLDMPAMTMVFQVRDRAALDGLKVGDKVRFKAVNEAGKYTVTDIQVVQ